jgi:hypothetical protein
LAETPSLPRTKGREAVARREAGETLMEIARTYNVSHSTIRSASGPASSSRRQTGSAPRAGISSTNPSRRRHRHEPRRAARPDLCDLRTRDCRLARFAPNRAGHPCCTSQRGGSTAQIASPRECCGAWRRSAAAVDQKIRHLISASRSRWPPRPASSQCHTEPHCFINDRGCFVPHDSGGSTINA